MTAEQRQRAHRLLEGALSLQEPSRSAYLDEACRDDTTMRELLGSLLEGSARFGGFLGYAAEANAPLVFSPDEVIADRLRIVRFVGRGGMGEVYEAWDERLGVRVGLKTLRADHALSEEGLARFRREILVARQVSHPNLCRVFDLVEHPTPSGLVHCLTMEWIDGETLQERLSRERPVALEWALPVIRQVGAALDALHDSGIVHRDLKPGNVMLARRSDGPPRAVVMDFGLAKPDVRAEQWFESSCGEVAGAPYFMAPELFRGDRPGTPADIFAFGLLIDEMVTKSRAFDATSLGAVIYQRLAQSPSPPSSRAERLPAHWDEVVLRCLANNPAERFRRAGDVAAALDAGNVIPVAPPKAHSVPWRLILAALLLLIGAAALLSPPRIETSMVVFPFNDLMGDREYRHLPTGLSAELVSRLTRVDGLTVRRYYRAKEASPLDRLSGRYHLDGECRKAGDRLRLMVRVTDAQKGGAVVWTETFESPLENPLDLQSKVARSVIDGLESHVTRESGGFARVAGFQLAQSIQGLFSFARVSHAAPPDPDAYRDYLRARQLLDERSPAAVRGATDLLHRAVSRAPDYAPAYALLSDAYRAIIDGRQGPHSLIRKSREYAEKAIQLDPLMPEGHVALAGAQQMEWDWRGAEQSYREAIRLDPRSPLAYRRFGGLLIQFGPSDEALELSRKGIELDPYDYPSQAGYGFYLYLAGKLDEAERQLKLTLAQRDFTSGHSNLGSLYAARARMAQGVERDRYVALALEEAAAVRGFELRGAGPEGRAPFSDYMMALFHAIGGDGKAARLALARLEAGDAGGEVNPAHLALVYANLGEVEKAAIHLKQAAAVKDRTLLYLKVLPHWEPLRNTREYREIVASMGL